MNKGSLLMQRDKTESLLEPSIADALAWLLTAPGGSADSGHVPFGSSSRPLDDHPNFWQPALRAWLDQWGDCITFRWA